MAYHGMASYYDALNEDANYDKLINAIHGILSANGIDSGIVADLGCGTGELTLRLAGAGYDMIAVDASPDMLSVLSAKQADMALGRDILMLCQDLTVLDLYGTIWAAVSTFDTFNHLDPGQLAAAIARASLFTETGGLLIFDINTPYKHRQVLGNNSFEADSASVPGLCCEWENHFEAENSRTLVQLTVYMDDEPLCNESFYEYAHSIDYIKELLDNNDYKLIDSIDGESFGPVRKDSQRLLMTAKKI